MKRFNFALLILILCSGCASTFRIQTGNNALTEDNMKKITTGMSGQDVLNVLGKPSSKIQNPAFGEIWSYSHTESKRYCKSLLHSIAGITEISGNVVSFAVNLKDGKVVSVSKTENDMYQPMTLSYT